MTTDFNGVAWTASQLLTEVYRAARLPDTGTVDYTPSVVLRMASDAIWNWATHQLSTARDGRMATTLLRAASGSLAVGSSVYELPPMGVADAVDSVTWVNGENSQEYRLEVIPASMLPLFTQPDDSGSQPSGYALMDGTLRVFPRCTSGSLKITYQRRHGELVVGSDTASLVSVISGSGGNARITLSSTPTAFVSGAWLDLVTSSYPYRLRVHGMRIVTALGSNVFDVDVPYEDFAATAVDGDTLMTYGKTPYVQLPLEMRLPLTQHIAANIMAELGDGALVGMYDARSDAGAQRTRDMLSPRTKADMPKLFNPFSLSRRGGGRGGRRWRSDRF